MTGQQINERLLNYSSDVLLITFFLLLISLLPSLYVYCLFSWSIISLSSFSLANFIPSSTFSHSLIVIHHCALVLLLVHSYFKSPFISFSSP